MAKVMFARLCREIKKNHQNGRYSLVGSFTTLRLANGPVGFVCVIYWKMADETFRQSFVLKDEAGHILDETPATECVLTRHGENVSTAFFYTSFPRAGHYSIDVNQNDVCMESIRLDVADAWQSLKGPLGTLHPLGNALQN